MGEPIELKGVLQPALSLTIYSQFLFSKNLDKFYENHPDRQNPDELLIGLNVRSLDSGGYGTITQLVESTPALKQRLIKQATGEISKQALRDATDEQPLVAVKYSKEKRPYYYAMAALKPCVSVETASRFGVEWGELLKAAKIPHQNRWLLLVSYNRKASEVLARYGFQLDRFCINSRQHPELFWQPPFELKKTKLLFGGGITGTQDQILTGLSRGGVYRRHSKYSDLSRPIRITALNTCDLSLEHFIKTLQQQLKRYKFKSEIVPITISIKNLSGVDAKLAVERAVNALMNVTPDIVLTFLPQSDRDADNDEGGSLYQLVYSWLLRRQIASQVIYENTLRNSNNYGYILNQVVPGILAKLGNLPFILNEPLEIADYFIGFDISREAKERLPGTMNACASVRLYGNRGEFIRYQMEDALIEGEEIPQQVLARALPEDGLKGKIALIYHDGLFRGAEVDNLLKRAKAIGAKFILVECIKSGVPRLYNQSPPFVEAPEHGLALLLSAYEAILVSTDVPNNVDLANPLRLKIVDDERVHPTDIKQVLETTLKLTLLHHGSLKIPRLPMPVYGAHKIAKLRLRGIYAPGKLSGDEQFWH